MPSVNNKPRRYSEAFALKRSRFCLKALSDWRRRQRPLMEGGFIEFPCWPSHDEWNMAAKDDRILSQTDILHMFSSKWKVIRLRLSFGGESFCLTFNSRRAQIEVKFAGISIHQSPVQLGLKISSRSKKRKKRKEKKFVRVKSGNEERQRDENWESVKLIQTLELSLKCNLQCPRCSVRDRFSTFSRDVRISYLAACLEKKWPKKGLESFAEPRQKNRCSLCSDHWELICFEELN